VIKVGLVGYGLAGSVFHEPLIRACNRLELASVLTSRDHPLRVDSLETLLERSDLVVVASPNRTHFPLAKSALDQGKHVVVDKPFTVTVEEADELIALAQKHERMMSVFHNRRWDSDFLTVQDVLPSLGEVRLFEANWDRFRPTIKDGWREEPAPGSGLFNDLGPHLLDQALILFGMPQAIEANIAAQRPDAKVDDFFDVSLDYGGMRVCLRASSLQPQPRPRFAIRGTRGSFDKDGLDPQEAQLKAGVEPRSPEYGVDPEDGILTRGDGTSEHVPSRRGNYLAFYDAVAVAILEDAPVPVSPEDARAGLALISLARRASELGQRLAVPDANSTAASPRAV